MKLRSLILGALVLAVLTSPVLASQKEFRQGDKFITPQLGINEFTVPFGASFEYAYTKNIGLGGTAMLWSWSSDEYSQRLIALSADLAYHFTKLKAEKLDVYAGGYLGFGIYSWSWEDDESDDDEGGAGSSGLRLGPFVGARYYLSPKMAVNLRLDGSLAGDWSGLGAVIGLTFKLD